MLNLSQINFTLCGDNFTAIQFIFNLFHTAKQHLTYANIASFVYFMIYYVAIFHQSQKFSTSKQPQI